jgi:hypothetical protein
MSLAVRNGSMASLYALRGQVSWSLFVADADGGEVLSRPRAGRRLVGCHYRPVLFW